MSGTNLLKHLYIHSLQFPSHITNDIHYDVSLPNPCTPCYPFSPLFTQHLPHAPPHPITSPLHFQPTLPAIVLTPPTHPYPHSDGLVAPWTALPTLVALTADPVPDLGTRALRLLRREETKAPQQYDKCLSEGVPLAYTLYKDMARAYGMTTAKQQQGGCVLLGLFWVLLGVFCWVYFGCILGVFWV